MSVEEIPKIPFPGFKWKWGCDTCTEGINDPLVLLGVLFRMNKLEGKYKYSSDEFANELRGLAKDLEGTGINVNIAGRVGERNLIRNSGQYWKALNLIPSNSRGKIQLTEFGKEVATHKISQTEFSAITIMTYKLPNPAIQKEEECKKWKDVGLEIHPLKLILSIINLLYEGSHSDGYLTPFELTRIVIPLSGTPKRPINSYVDYIKKYRKGYIDISSWPDRIPSSNDFRIAREYLLFLLNYGYLNILEIDHSKRETERYIYNPNIDAEIQQIINSTIDNIPKGLLFDTERKMVASSSHSQNRPKQTKFRKDVLAACKQCVITNVDMPEVLEAAHIIPHKYHGEEIVSNGFAMRMDMHYLFDAGMLRIKETGEVFVTDRVRMAYGSFPKKIIIPEYVNKDFIRWRWDNYNGI